MRLNFRVAVAFAVIASFPGAAAATELLTQKCTRWMDSDHVTLRVDSETTQKRIVESVQHPESDIALFETLWRPASAYAFSTPAPPFMYFVEMQYGDKLLDAEEIGSSIMANPTLPKGVISGSGGGVRWCGLTLTPGGGSMPVTEWYNRKLNHFFLSANPSEEQDIASGKAGPGWERTGQTFDGITPSCLYGGEVVSRFYNKVANTHFFTNDPAECGAIRQGDPGWVLEGVPFAARAPVNGQCEGAYRPVWRVYNGRWKENDSNHRFVTSMALYDEMIAYGWIGEGLAFCVRKP